MKDEPEVITQQQINAGRGGYNASLLVRPTYLDGSKRPAWENLSERAQLAWAKSPQHGDYFFPERA